MIVTIPITDCEVVKVNVICITNKLIAEKLKEKGFQYIPELITNEHGKRCTLYQFIQEPALIEELASNYEEQDFFIKKSVSF